MGRKVNLALITNNVRRNKTFKKRSKGLLKKTKELSTLCGVEACVIVFEPQELHPVVWPSRQGATEVISRFSSLPELEQNKRMIDQEGFLGQQVTKLDDHLMRIERENRQLHLSVLMHEGLEGSRLKNVGIEDVTRLASFLDSKIQILLKKDNET